MSSNRKQLLNEYFAGFRNMSQVFVHAHKGGKSTVPFHAPTHAQVGVLWLLESERITNTKEVAEHFCMTSSAATQLINKLVEEKYVMRDPDREDRRKILLSITKKGRAILKKMEKLRHKKMEKILSLLTDEELKTYVQLQTKIINRLKAQDSL